MAGERRGSRDGIDDGDAHRGKEDTLRSGAVRTLVDELVGDTDRALAVDEFAGDDFSLSEVIDAAQTPPFLTEHRVVVVRNAARFTRVDDLAPLLDYLEPSPTTALVLAWEPARGGRLAAPPKRLVETIDTAGERSSTRIPRRSEPRPMGRRPTRRQRDHPRSRRATAWSAAWATTSSASAPCSARSSTFGPGARLGEASSRSSAKQAPCPRGSSPTPSARGTGRVRSTGCIA